MSLRGFLVIVGFTDALAWAAWLLLLTTTNPESGRSILILFHLIFALALLGLFAVIGFTIRVYIRKRDELTHLYIKRTFRQATLLSLLVVIALMLSHNDWLRWWVLLLVIAALAAWEHFFLTGEETYNT
ncbi:MAG: hypothetical protein A3C15_00945 [Candidatus Magasanikbacteria bacterium RIFCSPHIGHO2_02_FULL_50_9b]|uniref:Uncharacterized protein n=1 Tax=Candidatus Magasanikbacteria bacterium RIFCSPHIGHO2_02_FULL_50_9b TaxID=1798682 RepID=A0A1F6M907_9BACT|nr:MAG: hypothetical protein A3C15_00945 [Candidatus Magasanikbacteria bacterium RIFCSPHIGHO2_02_FULL_50_9b]